MSTMSSKNAVVFPSDFSTTSRSSMLPAYPTPAPTPTPSPISPNPPHRLVHKEVGVELLERQRKRHRKQGEVPYPQVYNSQHLNFDAVDHRMLRDLFGGLTLKPLPTRPRRVLDLGCGGGTWILEAAKEWPDATFVGFDIHRRQPNLMRAVRYDATLTDLAKRIQWTHGNFLERLPFPDGEFDYARIQCVGLGVPEDEWQNVIEEMVRVLKPGGTLEVIEEDLLFPCPDSPNARTPRASPIPRVRTEQWDDGLSTHSTMTIREQDRRSPVFAPHNSDSESDDDSAYNMDTSPKHSPTTIRHNLWRFDFESREEGDSDEYRPGQSRSSFDTISEGRVDQRNHERLKECFSQMLNSRFINPQVTTVLPFYLQAAFADVQTMPALKVYLPSPSELVPKAKHIENDSGKDDEPITVPAVRRMGSSPIIRKEEWNYPLNESLTSLSSSSSSSTLINSSPSPTSSLPRRGSETTSTLSGGSTLGDDDDEETITSRARMALSRTLQMVRGCKEALYVQYQRLYGHERNPPNMHLDRDDFEMYFRNWVCDMQDRIGMRDEIRARLGWPVPPRLPDPEWREWREKGDSGDVTAFYTSTKPELLRCLRGFVCRTALPIISIGNGHIRRPSK